MSEPLIAGFDSVLFDLDGVVYLGAQPIPHAAESIAKLPDMGVKRAFVTNNSSRTPDQVVAALARVGVDAVESDVIGSAFVVAQYVANILPPGSVVLVVGGNGLWQAIVDIGLRPTSTLSDQPVAVVQGFHPDVGWRQLADAAYAVADGALWVASNADMTLPTEHGLAPGNGSLIQAVANATGAVPVVVGKPFPPSINEAVRRLGGVHPLIVGDRLDTDIEAGSRCGTPSLLVMTGVTDVRTLCAAGPTQRPTYVGSDLCTLFVPYSAPTRCADAVELDDWRITISDEDGVSVKSRGTGAIEGIRALAQACWAVSESSINESIWHLCDELQRELARSLQH